MPDSPDEGWSDQDPETEAPESAHDDIMKRLLDYQRSLREGSTPSEAADAAERSYADRGQPEAPTTTATGELVDLSSAEPVFEVESLPEPEPEPELDEEIDSEPQAEPAGLEEGPQLESVIDADQDPQAVVETEHEPDPSAGIEPFPEPAVGAEPGSGSVSVPQTEAGLIGETDESRPELEERLASLEGRLSRLGSRLGELRRSFQDMAVAADERLAAMEDEIDEVHREEDRD